MPPKLQQKRAEQFAERRREINFRASQLTREDWAVLPDCEEKSLALRAVRGELLTEADVRRVWVWMGGKE